MVAKMRALNEPQRTEFPVGLQQLEAAHSREAECACGASPWLYSTHQQKNDDYDHLTGVEDITLLQDRDSYYLILNKPSAPFFAQKNCLAPFFEN